MPNAKQPKQKRFTAEEVAVYRAVRNTGLGPKLTLAQAKREMQERAKAEVMRTLAKRDQWKKEAEERAIADAKAAFKPAFEKLSIVRDIVSGVKRSGRFGNLDAYDAATVTLATLEEAGAELERAAFKLGLYEGLSKSKWGIEGHFIENLARHHG